MTPLRDIRFIKHKFQKLDFYFVMKYCTLVPYR